MIRLRREQVEAARKDLTDNPLQDSEIFSGQRESRKIYKREIGDTTIVIKKFKKYTDPEFRQEASIANRGLEHPHIIQYYGSIPYSILMEYLPKGNAYDYFINLDKNNLPDDYPAIRMKVVFALAQAMSYLKSQSILHADIKLDNALLNEKNEVKLADFGFACQLNSKNTTYSSTEQFGTVIYHAPELFQDEHQTSSLYSFESEVWALAMATWIAYSLELPFQFCIVDKRYYDAERLGGLLKLGSRPGMSQITDQPVRELAVLMWDKDRNKRPDINDIVKKLEPVYEKYNPK